jgi:hypothetical protein
MDELTEQILDMCREAGLMPGEDAMRQRGFSQEQVNDAAGMILNSDSVEDAATEINTKVQAAVQAAELEQFIANLPEQGRTVEIENIAKQWGLPVDRVRACVEIAEAHDDLVERLRGFRDSVRKVIVME